MKILIVQEMWVNQTIEIIEIIKLLIEEKKKSQNEESNTCSSFGSLPVKLLIAFKIKTLFPTDWI